MERGDIDAHADLHAHDVQVRPDTRFSETEARRAREEARRWQHRALVWGVSIDARLFDETFVACVSPEGAQPLT